MNAPEIIALLLILFSLFRKIGYLLIIAFVALTFGGLAIIPPQYMAGANILAGSFAFLFIFIKACLLPNGPRHVFDALLDVKKIGLLGLFSLIAVIGAFVLPVVFAGEIYVFPLAGSSTAVAVAPSSGNINQTMYLVVSMLTAGSFFVFTRVPNFEKKLADAVLWGSAFVLITGILDYVAVNAGMEDIFDMFRTASYMFMTGNEVMGVSRVIGMMSEASSYGSIAAQFGALLLFTKFAYQGKMRHFVVLPMAIACLVMSAISTSTTAYIMLVAILAFHVADCIYRLIVGKPGQRAEMTKSIIGMVFLLLVIITALLYFEATREFMLKMFDVVVLKKTQSQSYLERSAWTHYALQAFFDSKGLGVGIGTIRSSNFFANLLGSTGVLGSVIFFAFLIQVFTARAEPKRGTNFELIHGSKLALMVMFVSHAASTTTPDYGVFAASLFGVVMGLSTKAPKRVAPNKFKAAEAKVLTETQPGALSPEPVLAPLPGPAMPELEKAT